MSPSSGTRENGSGSAGANGMKNTDGIEAASPRSAAPAADLICRQIDVYGIDSHISRFAVSDPQAARHLLERIQPARIFSQRNLVLKGDTGIAIFPCAAVVRVDFVMNGFPDWSSHHPASKMVESTEAEMEERLRPEAMTAIGTNPPGAGGPLVVFADITLANAERVFVRCEMPVPEPVETRIRNMISLDHSFMAQHILTEPSLYIRRRGGGAILLNSAHVVRLNFHSGMEDIPNAWPADLL
jgi:hypothetical protein